MPNYNWCCLACGQANDAGAQHCAVCACPALANARQIADFRARHVRGGGAVQAGAVLDPEQFAGPPAWLFALLLLPLIGYLPRSLWEWRPKGR